MEMRNQELQLGHNILPKWLLQIGFYIFSQPKQCEFTCIVFAILHHVGDTRIAFRFDE